MEAKGMKMLIVGGGGREDVLVWKIGQSDLISEIICAPGNAGIAQRPKTICLPIRATDVSGLLSLAMERKVDLTVVGPEAPLVHGEIVSRFNQKGLKIFGPRPLSADLEGSKVRAKRFMEKYGIPTAKFMVFGDTAWGSDGGVEEAKKFAKANLPCVVKANGLAAGKGVIPCFTEEEALLAIERMLVRRELGDAGKSIVIEEFLYGEEASFMVLTDGLTVVPLLASQDHKHVFDGDKGPMTGGMGAYAPASLLTEELTKEIMDTIINPTIDYTRREGWSFQGVLYAGLMITRGGPNVLEFNVRFGDPELQPLATLMESDIVPLLWAVAERKLSLEERIRWSNEAAVCVVMASGGYPGDYQESKVIKGLEEVKELDGVEIFYAGVKRANDRLETDGGRVLGVTAKGKDIPAAINKVYGEAIPRISWDGVHYRRDIGQKALQRGCQTRMMAL